MATKRDLHEEHLEKKDATMEDRLSNLPEDLKLCILSSLDTKHAVLTSILSKSWLPLWTRIPVLEFNYFTFRQLPGFQDFVKQLLCLRDETAKLQRLSLTGIGMCDVKFIKNFLDYAFNHSAEELEVEICQIYKYHSWPVYLNTFSDSLKSLKLRSITEMSCPFLGAISRFKNLRVLYLEGALITDIEPFLGFPVLEKLTLANCNIVTRGKTLSVHGPNLSDLKISDCRSFNCCELTTPNLRFFVYHGSDFPRLRAYGGLPVLDTISLDFDPYGDIQKKRNFDDVMSMLCVLRSAKSIRLFSCVLYLLSSFQDELVGRSSAFQKLESTLVLYYGHDLESFRRASNVKGYLAQNSPDAKFTLIHHDVDKYLWSRNCDDFF